MTVSIADGSQGQKTQKGRYDQIVTPMKVTTFKDTMIRKLKPTDKKLIEGEGNGFNIRVMPSGVKTCLYLYIFDGKRKEMNLGTYPLVTLETARERFDAAMPALEGSEKQIRWATSIRVDRLETWKKSDPETFEDVESQLVKECKASSL